MTETSSFDVDLSALLNVFGGHMYSTPSVFVRELVQNALDAIALRRREEDFDAFIRIDIEKDALRFTDNGIGLDRQGLRDHLSRIGGSSKRKKENRNSVIGQFGIGLLSGFLVADRLIVNTRKSGSDALCWNASAEGSYRVENSEHKQIGTEVLVPLRDDAKHYASFETIRDLVEHFVPYVQVPIRITCGEKRIALSDQPPWKASREELYDAIQAIVGEPPLSLLPIEHEYDRGILWISRQGLGRPACTLYQHGVLVSEAENDLLPPWAGFIGGIIETKSLSPTASRESFVRDADWLTLSSSLKKTVMTWIKNLPHEDPDAFSLFMTSHHQSIMKACAQDTQLLEAFADELYFESNFGMINLSSLSKSDENIYFVTTQNAFSRIAPVATARGQRLINACHVHETALLDAWRKRTAIQLVPLSVPDLEHFAQDALEHEARFKHLIASAQKLLDGYDVDVILKRFAPPELPALLLADGAQLRERSRAILSEGSALQKSLLMGLGVARETQRTPMLLNVENTLVSALPELSETETAARVIRLLYLQASALARKVPSMVESQSFSEDLLSVLRTAMSKNETMLH